MLKFIEYFKRIVKFSKVVDSRIMTKKTIYINLIY